MDAALTSGSRLNRSSFPWSMKMSDSKLRQQLYDSFANRAQVYHLLYEQLREEVGAERAGAIMERAIYQRGAQMAGRYAAFAPDNLEGLKDAFLANIPDNGQMFAPEVIHCDANGLDIKFHRCPLKQAWLDAGLSQEAVANLCHVAARVDQGLFEKAGFQFWADTYQPGGEGCCFLHIRPG